MRSRQMPAMSEMDIIYPVRAGENNAALRYSLRSIAAHFPHRKVWIVGHKPAWVSENVGHIPGGNTAGDQANVYNNIRIACNWQSVSEWAVIFNDDFFVTAPVDAIAVPYRGALDDHINLPRVQRNKGWWLESLETTRHCLRGLHAIRSYELHLPLPVRRSSMAEVLNGFAWVHPDNPPQWRTLYGNFYVFEAEQTLDVKCFKAGQLLKPYHSLVPGLLDSLTDELQSLFPEPCVYERQTSATCPPRRRRRRRCTPCALWRRLTRHCHHRAPGGSS